MDAGFRMELIRPAGALDVMGDTGVRDETRVLSMSSIIYPKGGMLLEGKEQVRVKSKTPFNIVVLCETHIRHPDDGVCLHRTEEQSGLEREMWVLACRNLDAWEKGDTQGTPEVKCFAVTLKCHCY